MSSFILKYVAADKLLHFLISYFLTITLALLSKEALLSSIVVLIIGLVKEIFDSKEAKNFFSILDLIANILGIAVAYAIVVATK
jgi:hypothetical protein